MIPFPLCAKLLHFYILHLQLFLIILPVLFSMLSKVHPQGLLVPHSHFVPTHYFWYPGPGERKFLLGQPTYLDPTMAQGPKLILFASVTYSMASGNNTNIPQDLFVNALNASLSALLAMSPPSLAKIIG